MILGLFLERVKEKMNSVLTVNTDFSSLVTDDVQISDTSGGGSHSLIRPADRGIRPDLEKIGFPSNVVDKAVELHHTSKIGTRRGRRRKQTIFYYVLAAYNALNIPIEPKGLAERCGLKGCEISKAMSRCSGGNSKEVPNIVVWTPIEFISGCYTMIANRTDLRIQFPDGAQEQIVEMAKEITKNDPNLLNPKPQMVAAAIVLYYLTINGINVNRKDFASLFNNSDMTINKLFKDVAQAYNK